MNHPENAKNHSLDWLDGIDIGRFLSGDMKLIDECCGRDVLVSLMKNLGSMSIYISGSPISEAKKRYIRKNYDGKNCTKLCRILDVGERFVYQALHDERKRQKKAKGQEALSRECALIEEG